MALWELRLVANQSVEVVASASSGKSVGRVMARSHWERDVSYNIEVVGAVGVWVRRGRIRAATCTRGSYGARGASTKLAGVDRSLDRTRARARVTLCVCVRQLSVMIRCCLVVVVVCHIPDSQSNSCSASCWCCCSSSSSSSSCSSQFFIFVWPRKSSCSTFHDDYRANKQMYRCISAYGRGRCTADGGLPWFASLATAWPAAGPARRNAWGRRSWPRSSTSRAAPRSGPCSASLQARKHVRTITGKKKQQHENENEPAAVCVPFSTASSDTPWIAWCFLMTLKSCTTDQAPRLGHAHAAASTSGVPAARYLLSWPGA